MSESKKLRNQCRYLRPDGMQCGRPARSGEHFCHSHLRHRTPRFRYDTTVPLLDNSAALQLTVTEVVQGVLSNTIDPRLSGRALYGLQIATNLLAQANAHALRVQKLHKEKELPIPEPVDEVITTEDGEELAPESRYWGPNGRPEPRWDLSRWMYVSSKKKKMVQDVTPQEVAETEFPEEGWMTDDELEHPKVLTEKLKRWREEDKREEERLKQQGTGLSAQGSENGVQGTALSVQTRGLDIQAVGDVPAIRKCRARKTMRVPGGVRWMAHTPQSEVWATASENIRFTVYR